MSLALSRWVALTVALATLVACSGPTKTTTAAAPVINLRVAVTNVDSLDPIAAVGEGSQLILRTACDGLVALDQEGVVKPALAESWIVSHGARKLTLRLRQKIRFLDGTAVDAEAIADALNRVVRPESASPWASLLSSVQGFEDVRSGVQARLSGVTAPDNRTVSIATSQPFSDLVANLAHPALIPTSPRDDEASTPAEFRSCAGPYSISRGASEGGYVLTRTTRSHSDNEAFSSRTGRPKTIRFQAAATTDDAFGSFTKGEVDVAPVPISAFPEVTSRQGFHRAGTLEVTYLAFGATAPPTNDRNLRRAVSLAIDRLVVIDAALGDGREPALRWLETNNGGEIPPACTSFIRKISDPDRAKSTLSQSVADPSQLKLTLHFDKTDVERLVIEALQVEMKDTLGIQVEVDGQDTATFQQTLRPGTAGVWLLRSDHGISSGHAALGSPLSAGSPLQMLGYADPVLDGYLLAAESATGLDQRKAWGAVEESACDEVQVTPLWFGVRNWMFAPGVFRRSDGSELGSMGEPRLRDLPLPTRAN